MKRDVERPPESIGLVRVGALPESGDPNTALHDVAQLQVGQVDAMVLLMVGTSWLSLTTKQAYHLGAALMRARARALRLGPAPTASTSEGTPD